MDSRTAKSREVGRDGVLAGASARAEAVTATIVLFLSSALWVHQYFFRVLPGTMHEKWESEFGLQGFEIGNVAAWFFYAYLITQPLAGVLIARFGGASVLFFASVSGLAGAILLANASAVEQLYGAQLLIGAGGSLSLVIALNAGTVAVRQKNYALFSGVVVAIGAFGAMLGQAPLAYASDIYEWRKIILGTVFIEVAIVIGSGFLMWRSLGRSTTGGGDGNQGSSYSRVKEVMADWNLWALSFIGLFVFLPMASFVNVWLLPFVSLELGRHTFYSTFSTTVAYMGYVVGGLLVGWIAVMLPSRKMHLLIGGSALGLMASLPVLYMKDHYVAPVYSLLFIMGLAMSSVTLVLALLRDRIPADRLPIALGIATCFTNLGGTLALLAIDYILKIETVISKTPTLHDYDVALACIPIGFSIAFAIACLTSRKINRTGSGQSGGV